MQTQTQPTDAEIRKELLARVDVIRVKITQEGSIHVLTWAHRGDGGQSPWWQYLGDRSEFTLPDALSTHHAKL
jgi:hypothetical protein